MSGKLYVVPTPVGNLDDMTFRAVKVLQEADLILAEDTRTSGVLLKHFDIHTPMKSHHKFNEHVEAPRIAERVLAGETIALISDAGTPGISDPGFMLSRECRRIGADVECLPGLRHLSRLLSPQDCLATGLSSKASSLLRREGHAASAARCRCPHGRNLRISQRLQRTLRQLCEYFGNDREACVCREISKLHESFHRGSLADLSEFFTLNQAKGEIVIVVGGANNCSALPKNADSMQEDEGETEL